VKAGWATKPLGEVIQINPPKREVQGRLRPDQPVSFVPMEDLGELQRRFAPQRDRPLADVYGSYTYFAENDVLLAKITPCFENGKLGISRGLESGVGFGSSEFMVLRCPQLLTPEYLFYFLSRKEFREIGRGRMTGAVGHKRIPPDYVRSINIPLPPLEEQRRIVAILDEAFEGLDRARANAEANLASTQDVFDAYLTQVFTDPPAEWEAATLGAKCHRITVGHVGPMANRYVQRGIPFLRSQNVRPFRIDLSDVKFIDDAFMGELRKSELRPGDVAIVRTGYPGTAAVIPDDLPLANCADLVIARPGPGLSPHFLAMLLNSSFGKSHVAHVSVGAAQQHFNVGAAKASVFPLPTRPTQERLAERAAEIREQTESLEKSIRQKIADISALRQSLLQKAFAGELT